MLTNRTCDRVEHYYAVTVPPSYDPSRRHRVPSSGGVGRSNNQPRNSGDIGALAGAEQFYVIPYGWTDAPWWSEDQVLNVNAIVDALKRTYNIDENRVVVSGVSDGATGAYYLAMRETTPFASFLPLNGFIMVLASIDTGIHDQLFPNNLRNKPFFVVNGGRDRLYPTAAVEPYVLHLKKAGVSLDYHPQPLGEHNTAWWPDVKDAFERFAADPRDPTPARDLGDVEPDAAGAIGWSSTSWARRRATRETRLTNEFSPERATAAGTARSAATRRGASIWRDRNAVGGRPRGWRPSRWISPRRVLI
jgi:hypothetical protein